MQRYGRDNHQEREPLGASHDYSTSPGHAPGNAYKYDYAGTESPYYDDAKQDPRGMQQQRHEPYQSYQPYIEHDDASSASRGYGYEAVAPVPPQHSNFAAYNRSPSRGGQGHPYAQQAIQSNTAPGADNFSEHVSGGMSGVAYSVADRNAREGGMEAVRGTGQLPPPPSRSQYPHAPGAGYNGFQPSGHAPETLHNRVPEQHPLPAQGSGSSLNLFSTPSATHSPARSLRSFGGESFGDDPYQALPSNGRRFHDPSLGVVNPNDIIDDGDDGLSYARHSQRNSMLSVPHSDRGRSGAAVGAAGIGAAAAAGSALGRGGHGHSDSEFAREKLNNWSTPPEKGRSKKWRWLVIALVLFVVVGAIVGGVVGSMIAGNKKSGGAGGSDSAADDTSKNGDLNINSKEIQALLNNKDLHKVFPGMDYTPLNTQYPDCLHNPPSQNNITRDVAVLSQLTNKIRLYGTDCNQTQMVIHAINQLKMQKEIKVWIGVWQDGNATTNSRQLNQMWDILEQYGQEPFEGVIVGNEILFREEMTITQLGNILDGVRKNLTSKNIKLPVASSDLGDDWQQGLADKSDYIMANIHPFFAGVAADQAASWTYSFWTNKDQQFWKSDKSKNVISETGWPSRGGKHCGASNTCGPSTPGAVASADGMNRFMNDWVCQALANGTNYFWFEAFDEPWKIRFNEAGKEWEDQWGLMDVNRKLKSGVKIPDCGGKTV
ncbi:Glycoside hydrolase, superfamily [Metarhizium album ARSEF 1941]|uniref:glucan endo-1,3-beta-D-glucosidase n=1 Tax=Metarhizium album (strain ARSEF 1941) TaxID=1081103 RepID=A0A0B2WLP2_METAS|nr:Glycoside hydrolase, superfamily [Metarhizium album ARSEF 1941]KHN94402.1 Glycoside hydrolase, superfamily [Metarhizium album ARSEF 1941]